MSFDPPPYKFSFIAAPDDLLPHVNALYTFETDLAEMEEFLPAYSGQLTLFMQGSVELACPEQPVGEIGDAFFLAPQMKATPFKAKGPVRGMGVSLTSQGWAALTGLAVNEYHSRQIDPAACLPAALAARVTAALEARCKGALDDTALADRLIKLVRDGVAELPQKHAALIRTTFNWLGESFSPRVEDLYERLPYSQRQAQRLIVRFFGQPPATLVRRYRAIRAASLLALPRLAPEVIAELREAYYDQAHFIRDIREFTGRTPRALGPKEDTVVKDMLGPEGYGMVDLIAKGEADSDSAAS